MNNKGPDWILCPSKKHPGFFYYFNVLSGETVWSVHCLPQANPQDGTPSTFEGNVVRSRNTKTVEFGKAEFRKYINNLDLQQKKDVMPTDPWNRRVTQEIDDNFSSYSNETESFGNFQVFKDKNKSTQRNVIPSQSWWNIEADLRPQNSAREIARTSKPFQLKSPKIKRFTNHYDPITSPILKSYGFSCRNAEICQKQEIRSQGSKQIFHENVESLNADDLRWKIMMKKVQKSIGTESSQIQTRDEQQSVAAPKRKVKFFIDITDEESLKLNGDIGNDDDRTVPSHFVVLNQNCGSPTIVQTENVKENLFLQNTANFDPLGLTKSLQTNDLFSLRTNSFPNSNTLNATCDDMKRLNLGEQLYMSHHTYSNVKEKLSTLCINYEDLHVHMTAGIEEWICCYLQIMEQFLHEMFQVTKATKFEPPCWFFQGLKRFKEVFSHYKPVCAITDLLLSMCGYCVKNGIVRTNIKPNQFIKLLCGGILLIEEMKKYTRDVDVIGYKDMLQQLIESMRNPNIFHDMQAIDLAYLGRIRYHMQQTQDYFHSKINGGDANASPTFGVSQKQPIKNKNVTNMNDSECILEVSDDGLSKNRYNTGFNYTNHKEYVTNINTSKVNTDWQNTDHIEKRININDENDSFYKKVQENRNNRNIDAPRLTRTTNVLTGDCNHVNDMFSGGINKVIASSRRDNLNYDKGNSYGVSQENDRRINDNEVKRVSGDGNNGGINKFIASGRRDTLNYDKRNSCGVLQGNELGINDNEANRVSGHRNNDGINKVVASGRRDNLNYDQRNLCGVSQGNDRVINDNEANRVSGHENNGGIYKVIASGRRDNLNYDQRNLCGESQGNDRGINDNEANRVSGHGNNGGINKVIASGRRNNLNYNKGNSYAVFQGNDRGINDNELNRVSDDGNVIKEKTGVEMNTIDESNVIDVIQTMVKTMRKALEALKVHCENCYNELLNGDLPEGRKKYLRKATDQALVKVSAMLLELKGITQRDESKDSPIQQILGDQGQAYRICIENCLTQTLIMESTLKYVIKVIDEG